MADTPATTHVATLPSSDAHEPAKSWTAQWADGRHVDEPVAYPGNDYNPDTRFGEHELPDPQVAVDAGFPPQPIPDQLVVPGHVTQSPLGESKLVPAPHLADVAKDVPNRDADAAVTDKTAVEASRARDPQAAVEEPLTDPRRSRKRSGGSGGPSGGSPAAG
jgi:hypothetical protein